MRQHKLHPRYAAKVNFDNMLRNVASSGSIELIQNGGD